MMPLYFGPSHRALYGVYEPAAGHSSRRGVVICAPMGPEYYQTHSVCRSLARRLAEAGVHTLRFDYLGTGDSALEWEDVGVEHWLEDIGLAQQELCDMAGLPTVGLIGIRAGATLSVAACKAGHDVDGVALWDPAPLAAPVPDAGRTTTGGEVWQVNPGHGAPLRLPSNALLLTTGEHAATAAAFAERLTADRADLVVVHHDERGPWDVQAVGPGSVPIPIRSFRTLVEWAVGT
jgi:hypothetical protein